MEDGFMMDRRAWTFRKSVPERYWRRTGLDQYRFRVIEPWHRLYHFKLSPAGCAEHIAPSILVTHRTDESYRHILLAFDDYPVMVESLLLLGKVSIGIGNRVQRYLTLYKAYEAVTDRPNPAYSSLRHALAHPATSLSSELTVDQLTRLIGTRFFDIDNPSHQRAFYIQMARLLMATDLRLGRLLEYASCATTLSSRKEAVHDWQIYDAWKEPIPLCSDSSAA
jgi:hypothetical protein